MPKKSNAQLKEIWSAARNRQEIVRAQLGRRELVKLGLVTSAGYLVAKRGLSVRASDDDPESPPTRAFIEALPIMPVKQRVAALNPAPTIAPNTAAGEGRTRPHQAFARFPPRKLYEVRQRATVVSVSPDLPLQTLWGFDGIVPGPTYHVRYGEPILVRNVNDLPDDNGGFGLNEVSTHVHNGHTPSESDGFPCDFFRRGQFYDQHYPNVLAGFDSTHPPNGDIREALSMLWYHDHRVEFTAQNVYKGLAGFFLLFNEFDTGDETTGFQLPSGEFDVPMMFNDKVFDENGLLFFDLFNLDGIIGDKFLVNGKIQPFFEVRPRRYRLRWLNGGPSRFYEFFLTDPNDLSARLPFWQISNDGNLLPRPILVNSVRLSVAERADVIIDFAPLAGRSIILENRLEQKDGRGPTDKILPAGQGDQLLRFDVVRPAVADNSRDPATITKFYDLPPIAAPRVTRRFRFERGNGQWQINGEFFDCDDVRFTVQRNTAENWILQNNSGGWQHPIHIHFEEFQILSRNGRPAQGVERSRKDVMRLGFNEQIRLFFRFRDFVGRYPMHCHNTIHEDHAMMLRFDIAPIGDLKARP
jgi:FtsP/CotA-like multicopper oxidase with cupredoxin domain